MKATGQSHQTVGSDHSSHTAARKIESIARAHSTDFPKLPANAPFQASVHI